MLAATVKHTDATTWLMAGLTPVVVDPEHPAHDGLSYLQRGAARPTSRCCCSSWAR